jgi:hypothetical protein
MQPVVSPRTANINTVPSPTGGLNAYDSLASMPATDAITLINMVPQPYGCTVRKGYQKYATNLPAAVGSLATWNSRNGTSKLFAFAGTGMWDISSSGDYTAVAASVSALTNAIWSDVQLANAAGVHTIMVNGADDPIWYSEAGIQRLTAGNGVDNGTINGVNPNTWIQVTIHQKRLWAVQKDTTFGWFLPAESVYGVAQYFDFGALFKRGGYLQALATWTIDAGDGADDHLVAISSEGEAAVYKGTDVTDATAWALIGVFYIGAPVAGRRFFTNIAGDLLLLTLTGVVSMSTLLTSVQVVATSGSVYSKKIQFLLTDLTSTLWTLPGWEIRFFPQNNLVYVNVPSVYAAGSAQLVANHITGSWCSFNGMDALAWKTQDDLQYFGSPDGNVYLGWTGHLDGVELDGSDGTDIQTYSQQAYTYLNAPAAQKQVGMYRPNFLGTSNAGFNSGILYDYDTTGISYASGTPPPAGSSFWDVGIWNTSYWGGGMLRQGTWQMARGIGVAASIVMSTISNSELTWVSTDLTYRSGGPL